MSSAKILLRAAKIRASKLQTIVVDIVRMIVMIARTRQNEEEL